MPPYGYSKWGRDEKTQPVNPVFNKKDLELCQCACCPQVNFLVLANGDLCDAVDEQMKHQETREHKLNRIRVMDGRTPWMCYVCEGFDYEMTDAEWDKHCEKKQHKLNANRSLGRVLMCDICNVELVDEEDKKKHEQSRNHLAKVRPAFYCEACKFRTNNPTTWDIHRKTQKCPLMIDPSYKKPPQTKTKYYCSMCDFYAPNNNKLRRHCEGMKHRLNKFSLEAAREALS